MVRRGGDVGVIRCLLPMPGTLQALPARAHCVLSLHSRAAEGSVSASISSGGQAGAPQRWALNPGLRLPTRVLSEGCAFQNKLALGAWECR